MISRLGLPLISILVLIGALPACTDGTTKLEYRFRPGQHLTYDWSIKATTRLQTPAVLEDHDVEVTARVVERVIRIDGEVAELSVDVRPIRVRDNGVSVTPDPPLSFNLRVTTAGRIVEISDDAAGGTLDSLQLGRLLAESRPPLSSVPVEVGDRWSAPFRVSSQDSSAKLTGSGALEAFEFEDHRSLARIALSRRGPVATKQRIGRTSVEIEGSVGLQSIYRVDVNGGIVYSSSTNSVSTFDLALTGGNAAGQLTVTIASQTLLISADFVDDA